MPNKQNQKHLELLTANIQIVSSLVASVKGTIGPKGLDVMLVDEFGNPNCTNDGIEILSNLKVNHPIAKLVIDALKSQELLIGDGTTSTAILIEAIINAAYKKLQEGTGIQKLCSGISLAAKTAMEELTKNAKTINGAGDKKLKNLIHISARSNNEISSLIHEAVNQISHTENYDLSEYIFGSLTASSQILNGIFIKKKSHFNYKPIQTEIKSLFIEGSLEPEPISSEAISTDEGVKKFEHSIQVLFESAKKISKAGINAVFTSSSMFPAVEEFFVKEGIFVLTHLKKSDFENLIECSNAKTITRSKLVTIEQNQISNFNGKLKKIEAMEELGGFNFIGIEARASILINAETETILEEKKRICLDAVKAMQAGIKSGYVVGEGIAELNLIESLKLTKQKYTNDAAIDNGFEVIEEALHSIFYQIAENADINPEESLRKINPSPQNTMGIDLESGLAIDLESEGIIDPVDSKISSIRIASEVALQILRINLIVQSK